MDLIPFPLENPAVTTSVSPPHSGHTTCSGLLPSPAILWGCRILCVVALCVSGYLAWTAFNSTEVFGCGGGEVFDCSHVLTSQYAKVLGIPVSIPAFAMYASMLAVLFFFRQSAPEKMLRACWSVITIGSIAAGLAALWFISVQVFELEHLCAYCLGAHACGIILAAIVIWKRPLGGMMTSSLASVSVAGVAALIAIQVNSEPPESFVVETFDDSEPVLADSEFSSPDADVFGAPDTFEAPAIGEDLFAPPVTDAEEFSPPEGAVAEDTSTTDVTESIGAETETTTADSRDEPAVDETDTVAEKAIGVSSTDTVETSTDVSEVPEEAESGNSSVAAAAPLLFFSPSGIRLSSRLLTWIAFDETGNSESDSAKNSKGVGDEKQTEKPKERVVSVRSGTKAKFNLKPGDWPLLGNTDAKYIFVEMFDYTCPHCRDTHRAIDGAFDKYGDDLAIIALAVPLDGSCNDTVRNTSSSHRNACELARIAVAVWRTDPARFKEFHDWMFGGKRSTSSARSMAEKLVGKEELAAELALPHAKNYISKHVELYKRIGKGSVPKLMFPNSTLTGSVTSTTTLCSRIESELGK